MCVWKYVCVCVSVNQIQNFPKFIQGSQVFILLNLDIVHLCEIVSNYVFNEIYNVYYRYVQKQKYI